MTAQGTESAALESRDVVLGRNSKVWDHLSRMPALARRVQHRIGHRDLDSFAFTSADRVWVFSYSRKTKDNEALLQRLLSACVREVVYVSSSSTIVTETTRCYEYPCSKQLAETRALSLPNARVLTIGLMYALPDELPAGDNVATSYDELAAFMLAPTWDAKEPRRKLLFRFVRRPFRSGTERVLYRAYGGLLTLCAGRPCLLRPIDLLLRTLRFRWYGYVYLSNRIWTTTIW